MEPALRAAIYQYRCRQESPRERLARLDRMLDEAHGAFDLVICPELFLSGYNVGDQVRRLAEPQDGSFAQAAAALAKKHGSALLYGYPELAGNIVYNAAMCIGAEGKVLAHHRKLALPNAFERSNFALGDSHTIFDLRGWKIGILVCYDVEFPEAVRGCASRGAHFVAVPTALKSRWGFVARNVVPTRAFENGIFVAYANYCGREGDFEYLGESRFVSPTGSIISADDQEALLAADLAAADITQARRDIGYLRDCTIFRRLGS